MTSILGKRKGTNLENNEQDKQHCSPTVKLLNELESYSKEKRTSNFVHELLFGEKNKNQFFRYLDQYFPDNGYDPNDNYQEAKRDYQNKIEILDKAFSNQFLTSLRKIDKLENVEIRNEKDLEDIQKWLTFHQNRFTLTLQSISFTTERLFAELLPNNQIGAEREGLYLLPREQSSSFSELATLQQEIRQWQIPNEKKEKIIGDISDLLLGNHETGELDLSCCPIGKLPKGIQHLSNLKSLNLCNTNLQEFPVWISKLTNLRGLDISLNPFSITNLGANFSLPRLKILSLDANHLHFLAPHLRACRTIQKLFLSNSLLLQFLESTACDENIANRIKSEYINLILGRVNSLDLSDSNIPWVPMELLFLPQLKDLKLARCQLKELPEWLGQMSHLESLDISQNYFQTLPDNFGNLSNLQHLFCRNSPYFTTIPRAVRNLERLETLDFSFSQLSEIPTWIGSLDQLKKLDLQGNYLLPSLPKEIGSLSNLEFLQLESTLIRAVPDTIGQLSSLKELYLGGCGLRAIPETIGNLSKLEILTLNDNQLESVPQTIGNLQELEELYLDNNSLVEIPSEVGKLSKLEKLSCYKNFLTAGSISRFLSQESLELGNLKALILRNNKIKQFPKELATKLTLEELDIAGNVFSSSVEEMFIFPQLKRLTIDGAQIPYISPQMQNWHSIEKLHLQHSSFINSLFSSSLPTSKKEKIRESYLMALVGNRESLDLSGWKLDQLPNELEVFTHLKELNVAECTLRHLPEWIEKLKNLEGLDISFNPELEGLPRSLRNLSRLEGLNCAGCMDFDRLPSVIQHLSRLKDLNLMGCGLSAIPDWIANLTQLERLDLKINNISTLPIAITRLASLEYLDLEENSNLTRLPEEIVNLRKLETFILDYCSLDRLPPNFGKLSSLKKLSLKANAIKDLPASCRDLNKLEELNLEENTLKKLPDSITKLPLLQKLYLYKNDLGTSHTLPDFSHLRRLKILDIGSNAFTSLPISVTTLDSLEELYCGSNQISTIPDKINEMKKLQKLAASMNPLTTISDMSALKELREIDFSHCRTLTQLPNSITKIENLEVLHIRECKIASLPEKLGDLKALKKLDATKNRIRALPDSFGSLTSLKVALFAGNDLTSWPKSGCRTFSLQELDLTRNQIIFLPEEIGQLIQLKVLRLEGNKLSSLPPSLLELTPFMREFSFIGQEEGALTDLMKTALSHQIGQLRRMQQIAELSGQFYTRPKITLRMLYNFAQENPRDLSLDPLELPSSPDRRAEVERENRDRKEKREILDSFISKLTESDTFFQNIEASSKAFLTFLHYSLENKKFSEEFYQSLDEGSTSCGDRVSYYLNKLQMHYYLESGNLPPGFEYSDIIVGDIRLTLLDLEAQRFCRASQEEHLDELEVFLALQVYFQKEFKLPLFSQQMRYCPSTLLIEAIPAIKERVLEESSNTTTILLESELWQEYLKKIYSATYQSKISSFEVPLQKKGESDTDYYSEVIRIMDKKKEAERKFFEEYTELFLSKKEPFIQELDEEEEEKKSNEV